MPDQDTLMKRRHQLYDDVGMALALALEHQEQAETMLRELRTSLTRLSQETDRVAPAARQAVTSSLDGAAQEAARLLSRHFQEANRQANSAAERYERAAKSQPIQGAILVVGSLAVLVFGLVALGEMALPTQTEIAALRSERADLVRDIANLESAGARAHLTTCVTPRGHKKPCVRVDDSMRFYAGGHTYRIIAPKSR